MPKKSYQKLWLEIEGQAVPLKLFKEWRNGISYSITNQAVVLRVPVLMRKAGVQKWIETAHRQTVKHFNTNPAIRRRFIRKEYQDKDQLIIGDRNYLLALDYTDRKTDTAKVKESLISLSLNKSLPVETRQKRIRQLLSRAVAKDWLPEIQERVYHLNDSHFNQNINQIRLKYNHSNWGSCSINATINLSTKLLFAPKAVIDYVIIHELAHLIELNHSPAYWKLVKEAMPDYKQHIKWLNDHGSTCDF